MVIIYETREGPAANSNGATVPLATSFNIAGTNMVMETQSIKDSILFSIVYFACY